MKSPCSNVLELPKDILQKLQTLLGRKKYMFLYVILSSTMSDESKNVKLLGCIHNAITYITLFDATLWGSSKIPTNKEFKECFNLNLSDKLSIKERYENNFEILKEISQYLSESPNHSRTDIIWNGKKIQTKKRYTKYFVPNSFWRKSFSSLKGGKYPVCGCTPFCWRCRNRCDIFNVKQGDKLVVKSQENGRYYICMVKIVILEDKYYTSVRDIYLDDYHPHTDSCV